jgi:hypothetical protein
MVEVVCIRIKHIHVHSVYCRFIRLYWRNIRVYVIIFVFIDGM